MILFSNSKKLDFGQPVHGLYLLTPDVIKTLVENSRERVPTKYKSEDGRLWCISECAPIIPEVGSEVYERCNGGKLRPYKIERLELRKPVLPALRP
jgi:hypothetical protein